MISKLGTYPFASGRVEISRRDTPEFNNARQLLSNTIRLDCSSALYATDSNDMDRQVKALFTAFELFNPLREDFAVYLPDGRTKSQLSLYSRGSIGGVRIVVPPAIESLKNAGYVTWLPFSFSLEAEYPAENAGQLIREWTESVSYSSPDREDWLLCLHGPHQKQQVRQFPFYMATQTGRAVGYLGYPVPSSPIWANAWVNRDEQPTLETPKARGNGYIDYGISWLWRFKSDQPLIGTPRPQPQ